MQHEAEPDRAIAIRDPAEENTGEYRRKRLGHRFLKMDHAIRHSHYQYRIDAERRLEAMDEKASKEKFEPEKLKEIDDFPNEQRSRKVRISVIDLEERVFARKAGGKRQQINYRQHHADAR